MLSVGVTLNGVELFLGLSEFFERAVELVPQDAEDFLRMVSEMARSI